MFFTEIFRNAPFFEMLRTQGIIQLLKRLQMREIACLNLKIQTRDFTHLMLVIILINSSRNDWCEC